MTDNHEKYGPRTAVVEKVIDRAGCLTDDEARTLATTWDAVSRYGTALMLSAPSRNTADEAAWVAARIAARDDIWDEAYYATVAAVKAAGWPALGDTALAAADAAQTAVIADLEGEHGLTREHLEILAGPWRTVIKDVDPLEGLSG